MESVSLPKVAAIAAVAIKALARVMANLDRRLPTVDTPLEESSPFQSRVFRCTKLLVSETENYEYRMSANDVSNTVVQILV